MFSLEALDHIALSVRDVARSAQWYADVLGFERLHPGLWNDVPVFVGRGEMAIALFPASKNAQPANARGALAILHFAFRAVRPEFLAAQNHLKARGIDFEFQDHEISHSIYFPDLDGHEIEITTYEL